MRPDARDSFVLGSYGRLERANGVSSWWQFGDRHLGKTAHRRDVTRGSATSGSATPKSTGAAGRLVVPGVMLGLLAVGATLLG